LLFPIKFIIFVAAMPPADLHSNSRSGVLNNLI